MGRAFICLFIVSLVLLPACGGNGDQTRPEAIASFPAEGDVVDQLLGAFRVDYDMPVTILNADDVRVLIDGVNVPVEALQLPGVPNSIYVVPEGLGPFTPTAGYLLQVRPGAAVNKDEHYALENFEYEFSLAGFTPLTVGSAANGTVTLLDNLSLSLLGGANDVVPTPGGAPPVGILTYEEVGSTQAFVQLDSGLATFELETDAAMAPIALTSPGTITSNARAIAADIIGGFFYCAFREDMGEGIRVYKIDPVTMVEADFLDLTTVPTGASTFPAGLEIRGDDLYVSAFDGATGTLAVIDLETFTEVDADTLTGGVQGVTLPNDAGPICVTERYVIVANTTDSTATRISRSSFSIQPLNSTAIGSSIDCVASRDGRGVFQPLSSFELIPRRPYVRRNGPGFTNANANEVSDLIGDTSAATTDATAMAEVFQYSRFLLILDGQIATRFFWNGSFLIQEDEDDSEDGIQALDLNVSGPGVTNVSVIGRAVPILPPPP